MPNIYQLIRPALFAFDAEDAHEFVCAASRAVLAVPGVPDLLSSALEISSPKLETTICGIRVKNPLGLAAGFDKNGRMLRVAEALGFGFMEVGSVTNQASPGNAKPRLFRLPGDEALINRLGLNNFGPVKIKENLLSARSNLPYFINIAKTNNAEILEDKAVDDIVSCFSKMYDCGQGIVLNLSCPNTKDGKTFEDVDGLRGLLRAIRSKQSELTSAGSREKPVLIKFSSDLEFSQLEQLIEVGEEFSISGYVLVNTSMTRDGLNTPNTELAHIGRGGLSGVPLQMRALEKVAFVSRLLKGRREVIGIGGVYSPDAAYALIRAGASVVELYTAMVYRGPMIAHEINRGLVALLERDGFSNISQVVGADNK